jgi:hypothetical protein
MKTVHDMPSKTKRRDLAVNPVPCENAHMERIAHVYEPDGTLFGSYVMVIPLDNPSVLQQAALSFAIEDGLDVARARKCRVVIEEVEEAA